MDGFGHRVRVGCGFYLLSVFSAVLVLLILTTMKFIEQSYYGKEELFKLIVRTAPKEQALTAIRDLMGKLNLKIAETHYKKLTDGEEAEIIIHQKNNAEAHLISGLQNLKGITEIHLELIN